MVSFTNFIAVRYLRQSSYEKSISPMIFISFISILTSAWALALVTAIMNGFEYATHEKIQSIQPQLVIKSNSDEALNVPAITQLLERQFPSVLSASPFITHHIILRSSHNRPGVGIIKAVNPVLESVVIPINSKIISKPASIEAALANHRLLIGKGMAKQLDAHVGDTVEMLYMEEPVEQSNQQVKLEHKNVVIGGIFDTGIEEYDANLVFCSLDFLEQILPDTPITHMSLLLKNSAVEESVKQELATRLQLIVYSWKDLYPGLVSALKLEKFAMIFIVLLICFIASMNIFSLLFMLITQKRHDIALLYALGCTPRDIIKIFIQVGMIITVIAAICGIIGAAISSYVIDHYRLITLPDVYYASYLPAKLEWFTALWVFLLVLIVSFISIFYPAYKSKSINIAEVLRHE